MLWGEAYDYAMCILEEMQWIKTKSIHAAEFFHGTLELVEKDTSLILFYGEDETRPLMDRVLAFAKKITNEINIFDTKEVALPFTDPLYRKIVSPMVLYAITERLSCHLEKERNPVSYTHLDVYKRQALSAVASTRSNCGLGCRICMRRTRRPKR